MCWTSDYTATDLCNLIGWRQVDCKSLLWKFQIILKLKHFLEQPLYIIEENYRTSIKRRKRYNLQ